MIMMEVRPGNGRTSGEEKDGIIVIRGAKSHGVIRWPFELYRCAFACDVTPDEASNPIR